MLSGQEVLWNIVLNSGFGYFRQKRVGIKDGFEIKIDSLDLNLVKTYFPKPFFSYDILLSNVNLLFVLTF